jgi:hypothetical protein
MQTTRQPKARRHAHIERTMVDYVLTQTHYCTNGSNEWKERRQRLLGHYIDLYLHNPETYPKNEGNEIHQIIRAAGEYAFRFQSKDNCVYK